MMIVEAAVAASADRFREKQEGEGAASDCVSSRELRLKHTERSVASAETLRPGAGEASPTWSQRGRGLALTSGAGICAGQAGAASVSQHRFSQGRWEEEGEQTVVHRVANADRIRLRDVVREPVHGMAERMKELAEEFLEELKAELREILGGFGGAHNREEFLMLQETLQARQDITQEGLMRANRTQLEILVAVKTGIQAFLHPTVSVTQTAMVEVFLQTRCRNIACQNQLPCDSCSCDLCSAKTGFCNACMCVVCNKFDFDINTCRWVGCDFCLHWTHTDCAIRDGQICMGPSLRSGAGADAARSSAVEMLFRCKACTSASELLGWVKDVFWNCAGQWDRDTFLKEIDCVRRIFHGSEDQWGKRLYWKAEEVLDKLKNGVAPEAASADMNDFFEEVKANDGEGLDAGSREMDPREACNRIAEVVQEAVAKMQCVAEEKAQDKKKARLALDMCDRELEDKKKELEDLQFDRQRKRQQIEELETIVKLKQAEADMFQLRADEARREADGLQRIVLAKSEKVEEEYATRYLKLRLNEVENERRMLFEKLHENFQVEANPSQMLMMCKIQDLLKRVCNDPKKETSDQHDSLMQ